ncbi:MAG: putative viral replication protein [Circoviridae sp.]|nr:MAG: putative viral replication protein [Circoviridae sp.]
MTSDQQMPSLRSDNLVDLESRNNESRLSSRVRTFSFTLNNYTETELSDLNFLVTSDQRPAEIIEIIFQPEIGKNGTKHLQGLIRFDNKKSFKYVNTKYFNNRAYLEMCKNISALRNYVQKTDTAVGTVSKFKEENHLDKLERLWHESKYVNITKTNVANFLNDLCVEKVISPLADTQRNRQMRDLLISRLNRNYFNLFITREEIEIDNFIGG